MLMMDSVWQDIWNIYFLVSFVWFDFLLKCVQVGICFWSSFPVHLFCLIAFSGQAWVVEPWREGRYFSLDTLGNWEFHSKFDIFSINSRTKATAAWNYGWYIYIKHWFRLGKSITRSQSVNNSLQCKINMLPIHI